MNKSIPANFKKYFWDYDLATIDSELHKGFVIERILEKGNFDSVRWIFRNYPKEIISNLVNVSRNISSKSRFFWQEYFKSLENE